MSPRAPRRALLALGLGALPRPALADPPGRELSAGPGDPFPTLAAAVAAARDGDTIRLRAGTYTDDGAQIRRRIAIRARGGMARLVATVPPPNGKAILVTDADVELEGLEFTGATSGSLNGAGIRYEGGHLRIRRCHFHGNQMNLLAAGAEGGSISIARCEFGPTLKTISLSHGLYVNIVGDLTIRDSLFHGAITGHQIKSRALRTVIVGSRIHDGTGFGSYNIDLPNGGDAIIADNVLEQSARSRNPAMIHYGGEAAPHPGSALRIAGNTVVNRLPSVLARLLRNQTELRAVVTQNRLFGLGALQVASGPAEASGNETLPAAPPLDLAPPWQS